MFSCKSFDDSERHRTVWEVSEAVAPLGGCPLLHFTGPMSTVLCGSFTGKLLEESPDGCFHSELSVKATLALHGTSVVCLFIDGGPVDTRGTGTLHVVGIKLCTLFYNITVIIYLPIRSNRYGSCWCYTV